MPSSGHGVVFEMGSPLAEIASVEDIDLPRLKNVISKFTQHDETMQMSVATGLVEIDDIKLTLAWDIALPTHLALVTAFDAQSTENMQFTAPDGESMSGQGIIAEMGRVSKSRDHYLCEIVISTSGAWV